MSAVQVAVIGPGMITQLQLLPSLYQLQRLQVVVAIFLSSARAARRSRRWQKTSTLLRAFPGHSFTPYPDYMVSAGANKSYPELYKRVYGRAAARRQCVLRRLRPIRCITTASRRRCAATSTC